jgi:hypothetical protein
LNLSIGGGSPLERKPMRGAHAMVPHRLTPLAGLPAIRAPRSSAARGDQRSGCHLEKIGGDEIPDLVPCREGGVECYVIDNSYAALSRLRKHGGASFAGSLARHGGHRRLSGLEPQTDDHVAVADFEEG